MNEAASQEPPGHPTITRWPILGWLLVFILLAGALQLYVPYPYDGDTAYHAAVGRLIREHGMLRAFPWTPFSWLADHYADKELLFHLLFVPLVNLDFVTASRIVGTLIGTTLLTAIYLMLRGERVHLAGVWTLVLLAASATFVFRFTLVRPFLLSIALSVVLLWAVMSQRLVVSAVVATLYPWVYSAFWQIPLLLLLTAETARLLAGERVRWRPAAAVLAGISLGVLLHPNSLNLVRFSWLEMADMLFRSAWGMKEGMDLGPELRPTPAVNWVQKLLLCVAMTVSGLMVAWRQRRRDALPLAFALAALGFGILTARSMKFVEYFVPFSAVSLALVSPWVRWRFLPQAALAVSLLYTLAFGSRVLLGMAQRSDDMPPAYAKILQGEIPPGAQVFTPNWSYTGTLMLALPERRFLVALNPAYFYVKSPELYETWYRLSHEAPAGSAETIRRLFGARYVLCYNEPQFQPFFLRMASEPGVRTLLFPPDTWVLFDLGGA